MADSEKFESFKQSLIDKNEREYGAEVCAKFGDVAMDESNAELKGLAQEQYDEGERLHFEFEEILKAAFDKKKCSSFFKIENRQFMIHCFKCRTVCPNRFGSTIQ